MPPSSITFHILLALALEDLQPLAIAAQIAEDSQSTALIPERSLYKALRRLEAEGLISRNERMYAITLGGRKLLLREKVRLGRATALLHQRT